MSWLARVFRITYDKWRGRNRFTEKELERLDVLKQRYVEELKSLEELQALNAKIKQLHAMQAMAGTRAMVQAEEAINRGIDGSTLTSEDIEKARSILAVPAHDPIMDEEATEKILKELERQLRAEPVVQDLTQGSTPPREDGSTPPREKPPS